MFPELLQPLFFGNLKDTDQRPFAEGNATEAARDGVSFTYRVHLMPEATTAKR
jgi:hypothetical protein